MGLCRQSECMPSSCGTITVEEPFESSNVSISNCSLSSSQATPNSTITVTATLDNPNGRAASAEAVVLINGSQAGRADVAADPRATATVDVDVSVPGSAGSYDVTVEARNVTDVESGYVGLQSPRSGRGAFRAFRFSSPTPSIRADGGMPMQSGCESCGPAGGRMRRPRR